VLRLTTQLLEVPCSSLLVSSEHNHTMVKSAVVEYAARLSGSGAGLTPGESGFEFTVTHTSHWWHMARIAPMHQQSLTSHAGKSKPL